MTFKFNAPAPTQLPAPRCGCTLKTRLTGRDVALWFIQYCIVIILGLLLMIAKTGGAWAQQLILNPTGAPTVLGSGVGKRGIWRNVGTVNGVNVDIVGIMTFATRDHRFATGNGQIMITSVGQDPHFADFYIYEAGTHNIFSNTGGVPVVADVEIQINDIDGPLNEQVYVNLCDGTVEYIRVDRSATTYRGYVEGPDPSLGTETFYLAGDRGYANQPVSGLEIFYPQTSTFSFGRTANNGFLVLLANPTYEPSQTYELKCGDFKAPVLQDDIKEQVLGEPVTVNILFNDSVATENDNGPANNSLQPSEYAMQAIDLVPPAGALNIVTDSNGHRVAFDVIGEGTWSYDDNTGELTFTPFVTFFAAPTPIEYRFQSPIILPSEPQAYSAPAQVSIDVGSVGLLKLAQLVDTNLNGYADPGETIAYVFTAENFGNVDLTNVQLAETQFSGAGIPPVITFQAATSLSPEGTLLVGEKAVYTATYTLVPEDMDTTISNQAEVTAQTPGGTTVSDLSDSENPSDGDGVAQNGPGDGRDDPTTIYAGSGPDRGDAPITYGDPQHADTSSYWIGAQNGDGDSSAQHSVDGTGDDLDGKDDESDENFPQLYGDLTRTITIPVSEPTPGSGYLQAFVDFGGDGTFLSLGDQVASDIRDGGPQDLDGTINGEISFAISVPATAVLTPTFARLRWSSVASLTAISTATDGEVEDYGITIKTPPDADRGDAPASYGDPQHIIEGPAAPEIYLGSVAPDIDLIAQNSATASGDDLDGSDDEDGVVLPTLYLGGLAEITVTVNDLGSPPQKSAYLQAFIDFDGDGTFLQAGEQVATNLQDGDALDKDGATNGSIRFEVAVPSGAITAPTFARFRWSRDTTAQITAFEGEVEDYTLTISSDPPPFLCDGSLYRYDSDRVVRRLTFTASGASYVIGFQDVGNAPRNLNANWGYNALDGYMYAVRPGRRDLYRLDGAGNFVDLANLPTGSASGSTAGDILPNGTMVYVNNNSTWQLISLADANNPANLGSLNLSQGVDARDIAYNPVDGLIYGIDQNSGRAFKVDPNGGLPGAVTVTEFGPAIYGGIFGSIWFDEDGRFYVYSNTTNNLFLTNTVTGEAQLIANSSVDEAGDSDGMSCRGPAPIPFGAIAGNVYNDTNASDSKDNGETNLGGGIGISVFDDGGTPADTSDDLFLITTDTEADGTYAVEDLLVNTTYRIELDESDPDLGGGTTIGTSNPRLGVGTTAGEVTTDQDFGFDAAASDLELSKYAALTGTTTPVTNVSEGDVIDWIITVSNVSGGSPSGVKVIDLIPSGFAYVSDSAPSAGDTYDPDTGLWFVDEILTGASETLVITTTVLDSGELTNTAEIIYSSLPDPDSDPATGPLTDDLFDQIADDDEASYSVNLATGDRVFTGRIFNDNGASGGTAHDAETNGGEAGLFSAVLEILDGTGTVIATPDVASDGSWTYALPSSHTGELTIRTIPANGYRAISEATTGLPGLTNPDPHDGSFTFTPDPFGNLVGLNFGLLEIPVLTQDQVSTVGRGQVVTLAHLYTATSDGDVTFSLADSTAVPTGAFSAELYYDAGCSGAPGVPLTGPLAVSAGQTVCIQSRVSAGAGAGTGSRFTYKIIATTAFTDTTAVSSASNTDEVTVVAQSGQVQLAKTVENETAGTPEATSNLGGANDVLLYRIYLENTDTAPVSNVKVFDRTPPYTALAEPIADPQILSSNLTCNLAKPVANAANYSGSVEWNCSGNFLPGEVGALQFRVAITP